MTNTPKEEAEALIEMFKEIMPFNDSKLFYKTIDETKKCVDYMEDITAKQCAIIDIKGQLELAERIFHDYGLGYMGAAISRNDFTKSALYNRLNQVKQHLSE